MAKTSDEFLKLKKIEKLRELNIIKMEILLKICDLKFYQVL